jgi:superfamily II DNA or RNA helicase
MKLIVNTLYTTIVSKDRKLIHKIDRTFAIPTKNFWFVPRYKQGLWDGKKHFFSIITSRIPTGLLPILERFLRHQGCDYKIEDKRPKLFDVVPVDSIGRFDLTSEAFNYQFQAVKDGLVKRRGIFSIATNGGKTIIAAALIKSINLSSLFLVNGKELLFQTEDVFKDFFPEISIYGAGTKHLGFVTIATAQSLIKLVKKKSDALNPFRVVFFDECHHLPSDTFEAIANKCTAPYRFGLSGTAYDEEDKVRDMRLIASTGPLIATIKNMELIDRGVSAVPKVYFVKSDASPLPANLTYAGAMAHGIVDCESRNKQIVDLIKRLDSENKSILILSPRKKQCFILRDMLEHQGVDVELVYGGTPNFIRKRILEEFRENGGIVIGTTVYDEGVDIPKINALVLAGSGKKKRRLLQRVGRALRKKEGENVVDIYDFYDWHNKYLLKHSIKRLQVHLEEGFEVVGDEGSEDWVKTLKSPPAEASKKKPLPNPVKEEKTPLRASQRGLKAKSLQTRLKERRKLNG